MVGKALAQAVLSKTAQARNKWHRCCSKTSIVTGMEN
jgi:hypothetical protein